MPVIDTRRPAVTLGAYDLHGRELMKTIDIEINTDTQAIELWQYLMVQAEKWIEQHNK